MIEALYIHIPFCDKICSYCDFSKILSDAFDHEQYLDALFEEYALYEQQLGKQVFKTIYFGGGTPSSLNEQNLEKLLAFFEPLIKEADEITFEANPESLTQNKILLLKKYGINRVSMGVQTFNQKQLRFLGRHHTYEQIIDVVDNLKHAGIENYSFDLIYALPLQTLQMFQKDVETLLSFNPAHISSYALIIEGRTRLSLDVDAGKYQEVDEVIQFQMYEYLQHELNKHGYIQYEVSNWAKDIKSSSRHNVTYWSMSPYLGLGLGSHGFIHNSRYANTKSITKYVNLLTEKKSPVIKNDTLTRNERMEETVFLGLRKTDGINIKEFENQFSQSIFDVFGNVLEKHRKSGAILIDEISIKLSPKSIFVSNDVLSDFLLEE